MVTGEECTYWKFDTLEQNLIDLARKRSYLPRTLCPESIFIDRSSLRQIIDRLISLSQNTGNEYAIGVLADTLNNCLVFGNIKAGDHKSVKIDWTKPGIDNTKFRRAMSIHTHPYNPHDPLILSGLHFSPADFESFLSDLQLICSVMAWSETTMLLAKTNARPIPPDHSLDRSRILSLEEEAQIGTVPYLTSFPKFHKLVCLEFGLVTYIATPPDINTLRRVRVVES